MPQKWSIDTYIHLNIMEQGGVSQPEAGASRGPQQTSKGTRDILCQALNMSQNN